ncbi:hypothetical protein GPL17_35940 [Bradyrhizobium yuanmingense]|uniref:hypothetical protein n=1 Tax=Bradyrhizobium yuanmingense TaxID=108015 RepID=UPI0012F99C34|nr:hypothetical protein [Bradyrhizobium yuanmingense]MDF0522196.1 hypothetical protein [Bradyrhizobium yuanmingense]MVT55791.1 hypothetical protein [Bradyrhizobium yuanmingense]
MSPEQADSLIFDASVTINFLGTGIAGRLVELLGQPIVMADRTFREIQRHPIRGRDHAAELDELVRTGFLRIETLNSDAKELFFELTGDNLVGGLDDGEAAAIALATFKPQSALVITDDRKARNVVSQRWPQQGLAYSIDLLVRPNIESTLSRPVLADAVYSALKHARMRVPAINRDWAVKLIGENRATECPSLGSGR